VGDSVKVGLAVQEGKGKTRTQKLEGVLIADDSAGVNKTVTFRRIFQGVGIELVLPVHSPIVQSIEVLRNGRVRRSKLYYLRDRVGKAAKLKEVLAKKPAPAASS
jgi:large subunit ribosomal protein L19